jgi:hypothetical protein
MIDATVRPLNREELATAYFCANRTAGGLGRRSCMMPAKVMVGGRPFCLRCSHRERAMIAGINAQRAEVEKEVAAIRRWYAEHGTGGSR